MVGYTQNSPEWVRYDGRVTWQTVDVSNRLLLKEAWDNATSKGLHGSALDIKRDDDGNLLMTIIDGDK
jgi:hypothetical protein